MSCLRLAGFPGNLAQRVDVVNVLVTPHLVVIALAPDSALRAAAYRSWLYELIEASEPYAVRDHLKQERVLGDARFQAMVEKAPDTRIHEIVNERRGLTADTAERLARYFGGDAASWLNLQATYDLTTLPTRKEILRRVAPRAA
jgi:plasmid maintenance system antidote protein VapI